MFVIEVIPLKKGIALESLSYYSALEYPIGTLLEVPIKNSETRAVVITTKPVSVAKTALRTATFSLRKLKEQKGAPQLSSAVVETAQKISETIPAHIGSILFALLPPDIRSGLRLYPQTPSYTNNGDPTPLILTDTTANRYMAYKSHIRQTFAHNGSVLFIVPTSIAVERAKKQLEVGIEKRVITFSSTHTKKQMDEAFEAFDDLRHAKLIISTPNYAFIDRHDITTIVVESSGSQHYISRTRPYLDTREALIIYAKVTNRSLLLGDVLPLTEHEVKRRDERYHTYGEHTKRLNLTESVQIVPHEETTEGEEFSLCTKELEETIRRTLSSRGRIFLYASRRGLAPLVTCYDCGYIFRCPDSHAPYSLLRTFKNGEELRWFYSSASGKRVRAADVCSNCGSWRLREQGFGIQNIYDTFKKLFPDITIFLFDHTTATTHKKAKRLVEEFYETKKSILIGTTMALTYMSKQVETSAVISYEAMRTIPTWRADETTLTTLFMLREITSKDVIVQTRSEADELLTLATKGLIDKFYDDEIEIRKALHYPPFAVFILLSWRGNKAQVEQTEASIQKQLRSTDDILFYSAPLSDEEKTIRYGLLRIDPQKWPDQTLMIILRNLPPFIKIEVNPVRIV